MTSGRGDRGASSATPDWDEGVASERTVLAWERTAIASLAVAALVLRAGIVEGLLGLAVPMTALLLVAGTVEWWFSRRLSDEHARPLARGAVLHDRAIVALGALTLTTAAASVVLALGA